MFMPKSSLKKHISFIVITFSCISLLFSGCGSKTNHAPYTMDHFENTEWGMTPQEVLHIRGLSFEDVRIADIYEGAKPSGYQTYSLVAENEKVLGLSAAVTYWFTENYIPGSAKTLPSIGLRTVIVDFKESGAFDAYMKQYGDDFTSKTYFTASDLHVSDELQQKISDFRARRSNGQDPAKGPASEWMNSMVQIYTDSSENHFQVRYDGINMALANFLAEQEDPYLEIMEEMNPSK